MPRYGPGTKVVLRGLNNMLPDEVKQRSEKDQGTGTRLVMRGLRHALPSIAERNEHHSKKREPAPKNTSAKPKHRPSKPPNQKSHKKAEKHTSALIPYRKGPSSSTAHSAHENRQEQRNRGVEIEEEMAPGMRAPNSRSRQPSVGTHRSKREKASPSRSTFSQRGFRDV
ncbi:hypothetical protein BDR22DRAFT_352528 [Usnea florida]